MSGVISDLINSNEPSLKYDSDDDAHYEIQEGKLLMRVHRFRERDRKIIKLKKEKVFKNTGSLKCEGCDFDFKKNMESMVLALLNGITHYQFLK